MKNDAWTAKRLHDADKKEKERLREELNRQKDKAVKAAAATSALLQLPATLLLSALVGAPHSTLPTPPNSPLKQASLAPIPASPLF